MKKIKKILFAGFICLFCLMNVSAKQNFQIEFNNSIDNVQNVNMFGAIVTKKFDTSNVLCTGKFGFFIKQAMQLIKFAVPIIIIALAVIDFVKAMSAQKQEELKNAANKLVKRMIIGAIIFLLPSIIDMLLDIAGITSSTCGW